MGAGFYDQVKRILLANGCFFDRQGKGSHEIWKSPISNKSITLPVTVESRHTANAILKQAGIDEKV
ncbi:MAG TPA: type II toxin-antitoxin system HicA family toxin [Fluviicoccus sp.]|nr:type II toxin-antitoxin system HicA family toxin [Fluviicoccus sp.]